MKTHDRENLDDQQREGAKKPTKSADQDGLTTSMQDLQATAGNRAVTDLVGQAGPALQGSFFGGGFGGIDEWMAKESPVAAPGFDPSVKQETSDASMKEEPADLSVKAGPDASDKEGQSQKVDESDKWDGSEKFDASDKAGQSQKFDEKWDGSEKFDASDKEGQSQKVDEKWDGSEKFDASDKADQSQKVDESDKWDGSEKVDVELASKGDGLTSKFDELEVL